MIKEILNRTVIGNNTIEDFIWFAGILLLGVLLQLLFTRVVFRIVFEFIKKHSHGVPFEKLFVLVKGPAGRFILYISIYFAFERLTVPDEWGLAPPDKFGLRMLLRQGVLLAIAIAFIKILIRLTDFFGLILLHRASLTETKADDQLVPFIRESIKVVIVILGIFFILGTIFQMNVASLIAGLGIGGIAVALASRESIENLFGSFIIFLDKPFLLGDHVKVGNVEGIVEKIGFRSTQVRTLEKTLVTLPNKKMVDQELDNLSMRTHRRVKGTIGLAFSTTHEQVEKIVSDLRAFFDYHPNIDSNESKVHFEEIGNCSLNLSIIYYVVTNDTSFFIKVREEVNYKIVETVHKNGSAFAYPTHAIVVQPEKKNVTFL